MRQAYTDSSILVGCEDDKTDMRDWILKLRAAIKKQAEHMYNQEVGYGHI